MGATTGIGRRGEGGQFELPVEVGPAYFPMAEGIFEVQRAFPSLGGLGKLAQIGDLGQVKVGVALHYKLKSLVACFQQFIAF